ncbi:MAG: ABC transporter ATP-binding protein [Phycisphaerae bacterium]|nr:ABC transporter ATP-binding protein [Phycisphaerae bacterium]
MPTAIHIDAVSKSFGSGPPAVDRVSLLIHPGELFFLLGPSGCGKTTLLRMIAGFIEPTSGRIRFGSPKAQALQSPGSDPLDWEDITALPPNRRDAGMVFQSYALWPHMTVEANVAFGLSTRRVPPDQRRERVMQALEAVHMAEYAARRPNQLSGGQQQRVALARALVIRPRVLLLDEPLSNLDTRLRLELRSEIRRICKSSGITTVYVTHDQKEALSMADRLAIVSKGRLAQVGTPRELYTRPTTRFVATFLGEANIIPCEVIGRSNNFISTRSLLGIIDCHAPAATTTSLDSASATTDSPSKGATWHICVRPEHTTLSRADTPNATVRSVTYLGDTTELELDLDGHTVRASLTERATESEPDFVPGDRVAVSAQSAVLLAD